jgi:hypothetical protein
MVEDLQIEAFAIYGTVLGVISRLSDDFAGLCV